MKRSVCGLLLLAVSGCGTNLSGTLTESPNERAVRVCSIILEDDSISNMIILFEAGRDDGNSKLVGLQGGKAFCDSFCAAGGAVLNNCDNDCITCTFALMDAIWP